MDEYFLICEIELFIVVALCDLMHGVNTLRDKRKLLTTSGYLFLNMSDSPETAICKIYIFRALLIFQKKNFLDDISSYQRCKIFRNRALEHT